MSRLVHMDFILNDLATRVSKIERNLSDKNKFELIEMTSSHPAVLGIWPKSLDLNNVLESLSVYSRFDYTSLKDGFATRDRIANLIRNNQYFIVQIGAHGDANYVYVDNNDSIPVGWWVRVFKDSDVFMVILMYCDSDNLAKILVDTKAVQCVIYSYGNVTDEDVVKFISGFYSNLNITFPISRNELLDAITVAYNTARLYVSDSSHDLFKLRVAKE